MSWQKELYANPKSIKQIKFVGQLKKIHNNGNFQSMFLLAILGKVKNNKTNYFWKECSSLIKDHKLRKRKSWTNKYKTKLIESCSKK